MHAQVFAHNRGPAQISERSQARILRLLRLAVVVRNLDLTAKIRRAVSVSPALPLSVSVSSVKLLPYTPLGSFPPPAFARL